MSQNEQEKITTIGIVGGGKGGSEILSFLAGIPSLRIEYIVDKNPAAIAFTAAKAKGIVTSTSLERTVSSSAVDFIIEATGARAVLERIEKIKPGGTEIIPSRSALLIFRILEENRRKTNSEVKTEIEEIQTGILADVKSANQFLMNINDLTFVMNILSINAAIEAARSGETGAGFAIVAEKIKNMSDRARTMAENIKNITGSIEELSRKINTAMTRLG